MKMKMKKEKEEKKKTELRFFHQINFIGVMQGTDLSVLTYLHKERH